MKKYPKFKPEKGLADFAREQRRAYFEANKTLDAFLKMMDSHPLNPFQHFTLLAEAIQAKHSVQGEADPGELCALVAAALARLHAQNPKR
jgi:hypothetical protein